MEELVRALATCLLLPEDLEAAEFLIHGYEVQTQRTECLVGRNRAVEVVQLVIMIGYEVNLSLGEGHGNSS